jgi:hypothetical protein
MSVKMQLYLDPEVHRRARERAMQLGVSMAEYVRRLLARDLERPERVAEPSFLFNLGDSGGSDIARQKDAMVAEAAAATRRKKGKRH